MKTAFVLIFCLSSAGFAGEQPGDATPAKRLKSITWDLQQQTLGWVVENGVAKDNNFVPSSEESYSISPKDHNMAFQGEQRAFTEEEGTWLIHLLNVLTVYCAESTVWWANADSTGSADRQAPAAPAQPEDPPDTSPTKIKISFPQYRTPGALRLVSRNSIY